jgi:eukaryotic-like serine/threonine-protein kinase
VRELSVVREGRAGTSLEPAETAAPPARAPGVSQVLTPELLRAAARRLKFVGFVNALLGLVFLLVNLTIPLPLSSPAARVIAVAALVFDVLLSLAMAWLSFQLDPRVLLDVAVGYAIALGFAFSLIYHSAPIELHAGSRGWSTVAVWIIVFALLIPNTRRKMVFAALATAAMDPLGFGVHLLAGAPVPSLGTFLASLVPTAIATAISLFVSRILYDLGVAAKRARELGSYHLIRPLGRGGMGEVWEAEHRLLARSAAIKLIRPDAFSGDTSHVMKRFEREARATAALRSPHTVEVYDFGVTEDGAFYYVMELLTGLNADTLVRRHGPLPPERAVYLLLQVCRSLEEAHARDLVHRDIKPANIFVCCLGTEYDFVKVLDFGLVKPLGATGEPGLTAADVVAGTPECMAPEIARGERDFDHRADIYSLGCVAYWLVAGKPVFEAPTALDVLIEHVRTRPKPPSQRSGRAIPEPLEKVILDCLEKDAVNRPRSVRDLAGRLEDLRLEPWTCERAEEWWRAVSPAGEATADAETVGFGPPPGRVVAPART